MLLRIVRQVQHLNKSKRFSVLAVLLNHPLSVLPSWAELLPKRKRNARTHTLDSRTNTHALVLPKCCLRQRIEKKENQARVLLLWSYKHDIIELRNLDPSCGLSAALTEQLSCAFLLPDFWWELA